MCYKVIFIIKKGNEVLNKYILDEESLAEVLREFIEFTSQVSQLALKNQEEDTRFVECLSKQLKFLNSTYRLVPPDFSAQHFNSNHSIVEVDTPHDGSCLFYSVTLSVLLPSLDKEIQFQNRFNRLFGTQEQTLIEEIRNSLKKYNGNIAFFRKHLPILKDLIENQLRSRIAALCGQIKKYLANILLVMNLRNISQRLSNQELGVMNGKLKP